MKTFTLKGFLVLLLACTAIAGVSALGFYLSNIYQHSVTVTYAAAGSYGIALAVVVS